ncbi:hypothetical protein Tco_0284923 [Tanacetum coccineum]
MNSTNASSSNSSKKIKLTIITPRQLFVNISSDEEVTTTPSSTTTSSTPTPPNASSKTPSTNQTSLSQDNASSSFQSKLQISPSTIIEPTSPQPLNPLLENILDIPPRPLNPQPLQSLPSLDITLSLSPITPLKISQVHLHHHHHHLNLLSWNIHSTTTIITIMGLVSTSGIRAFALRNFDLEVMEFESAHSNTTTKLPILKLGEYEMWLIRIKQYFQVQDYALWEVIENGNSWVSVPQTTQEDGTLVTKISVPITAEEKTNKKNDVKARSLILMVLLNEHQLTFSQYNDAKTMFAADKTRFGGNEATKKTQKTLLKQQYENFSASSTESLDSIFNRLQKIVSRLAILGIVISQEDLNSKFLSSLPPEWNTHVVVWMNKAEIERITRTKRSKNSQKPTRNERDKKKSEETAKDQSRIKPTQQERQSKVNIIKPRTFYDKLSKFKGLFDVLEFKGPKLPKVEK